MGYYAFMASKIEKQPVVVVLGHVDHGKSSILEKIKEEIRITGKESGGITQHIGGYEIERKTPDGKTKKITFIDTPGHKAFSAMRERGTKVADVAVLVVDASEGVKPQTKETINIIKKMEMPKVVAMNKIDKPNCQIEWVAGQLKEAGIAVESIGGDAPVVKTSAKTGEGINELLDTIVLVSEMEELKTTKEGQAEGVIIDSALKSEKGPVTTILSQRGIINEGDYIATPSSKGKVKNLTNFLKERIKKGEPSQPLQVLGFENVPRVGESFKTFKSPEEAENFISQNEKESEPKKEEKATPEKSLKLILKADTTGTLEAIANILEAMPKEEVGLEIIKKGTGDVTVSDVQLALNSKARVIGFKVKTDPNAKHFASQRNVFPKFFDVIYELSDFVKKSLERMLSPQTERVKLGKIKILALFKKSKKGQIIGGRVIEGEARQETMTDIYRNQEKIGEGRIKTLQEEKKAVPSVGKGREAGMLFQSEIDIEEGDLLEIYTEEKKKKEL